MAHTKAKGTSKLGRDSRSQRLGVKIFGGQYALAGAVLVRQRGTKYHPGENVGKGVDDTLFARKAGKVVFSQKRTQQRNGAASSVRRLVSVAPVPPVASSVKKSA